MTTQENITKEMTESLQSTRAIRPRFPSESRDPVSANEQLVCLDRREASGWRAKGVPSTPFERITRNGNRYYFIEGVYMPSVTTLLKVVTQPGIDAWKARVGLEYANNICTKAASNGTIVHELCEIYLKQSEKSETKRPRFPSPGRANEQLACLDRREEQLACLERQDSRLSAGDISKFKISMNEEPDKICVSQKINPIYINDIIQGDLCTYFNEAFLPMLANISDILYQEVQLYSHTFKFAGTVDCIAKYNNKLSIIDFKTSAKPKLKKYITSYFLQTAAYSIAYKELTGFDIENLVILIGVNKSQKDSYSFQVFEENINNICPTTKLSWRDSFIQIANNYNINIDFKEICPSEIESPPMTIEIKS